MKQQHSNSRRQFLKRMGAASIGASTLMQSKFMGAEQIAPSIVSGKVKIFIIMVSDGMNNGTFAAANHWLNLRENRDSSWMQLYKDGLATRRLSETSSANSIVTDSAAASSAWGIGQRVENGAINFTQTGTTPTPLGILAKENGKSTGMVTTARITHATPAGFAANVKRRNMESTIASQYLDREIDVLLGGGDKHFNSEKRKDSRDLYSDFRKKGYDLVRTRDELLAHQKGKTPLLGIFSNDHFPYVIDRENQKELGDKIPTLGEMTMVALQRLNQNPEGFVLQVEAARVDHAAHGNDPVSIIPEQLEFDRTISLVRKFAEEQGDTLVVVTSDHGTGGFMLCGADTGYHKSEDMFKRLWNCCGSISRISGEVVKNRELESWVSGIETYLSITLLEDEYNELRKAVEGPKNIGIYNSRRNILDALNPIFFNRFSVNWDCHNHTADLVEFAMFGPSSDILPGFIENWQVHGAVRELLKI